MSNPNAYYEEFIDEEMTPEFIRTGFVVDSLDLASWAVRKIALAERRKQERLAYVAAECTRLEAWAAALNKIDDHSIEFLTHALEGYYRRQAAAGALGKAKSLRLPYGRLQMRVTGGDWTPAEGAEAEGALLTWARQNGLTHTVETAAWGSIKAGLAKDASDPVYELTGECVPGVVRNPPGERFRVIVMDEEA